MDYWRYFQQAEICNGNIYKCGRFRYLGQQSAPPENPLQFPE